MNVQCWFRAWELNMHLLFHVMFHTITLVFLILHQTCFMYILHVFPACVLCRESRSDWGNDGREDKCSWVEFKGILTSIIIIIFKSSISKKRTSVCEENSPAFINIHFPFQILFYLSELVETLEALTHDPPLQPSPDLHIHPQHSFNEHHRHSIPPSHTIILSTPPQSTRGCRQHRSRINKHVQVGQKSQ